MGFFDKIFKHRFTSSSAPKEEAPKLLSYKIENLQGIGAREMQEDSFCTANASDVMMIKQNGLLAIVADGMGGLQNGKAASEMAIQSLRQDFMSMDMEEDIPSQLYDSVMKASDLLYQNFGAQSGTTVVECVIYKEMLYFISVGDSFLYLKRGNTITRINKEHNLRYILYRKEIENSTFDRSVADDDPDSHKLSQFVGKDEIDEVDMFYQPMRLYADDVIFLASDGVGGVISPEKLKEYLSLSPEQACAAIEQDIQTQNRQFQDNYTALIVKCVY